MMAPGDVMELCRLCLVKDRVQIPIFEGEGDVRQIFLKIAACLPVKVRKEDRLPKRICDECMSKVELMYQFWNTTSNAEKQLLEWLGDVEEPKTEHSVKCEQMDVDPGSELAKSLSRVEAVLAEARDADSDNDHFDTSAKPETDSDDDDVPLSTLEATAGPSTSAAAGSSNDPASTSGDKPTCGYFIDRKKRFCRMTVARGASFCGEHGDGERVPCPLDPNHSCFRAVLAKHIKKCNARRTASPNFIVRSINVAANEPNVVSRQLSELSEQELQELVEKIETIAKTLPKLDESVLRHEKVEATLQSPECGSTARKHLVQATSLLANMEKAGFIDDGVTFVEFGAGRGQLSYWLGEALEKKEWCSIFLIDRASARHKHDNKLKGGPVDVKRVRADIADLDLCGVVKAGAKVVGVCKHLCGEGTDLSLQCLLRALRSGVRVIGLMMAPCCHHRCTWRNFLGQEFLLENGFQIEMFTALCGISSWATCGNGRPRNQEKVIATDEIHPMDRYSRLNYDQKKREMVGRKAKMILNHARLKFMEKEGSTPSKVCKKQENINSYTCNQCSKGFRTKSQLSNHFQRHDMMEKQSYQCADCSAVFINLKVLTEHTNLHTGSKPFSCDQCQCKYPLRSSLARHKAIKHNPDYKPTPRKSAQQCELCGKNFFNLYTLKIHMRVHDGVKFDCKFCDKQLSSHQTLLEHINAIHTGNKPFSCETCSKSFVSEKILRHHKKIHSDSKPHVCNICAKTFVQKSAFVFHMRYHLGQKPFVCSHCRKGFVSVSLMKRHVKLSHEAKPKLECSECGEMFVTRQDLRGHIRDHIAYIYTCDPCNRTFDSRSKYSRHVRRHGREDGPS